MPRTFGGTKRKRKTLLVPKKKKKRPKKFASDDRTPAEKRNASRVAERGLKSRAFGGGRFAALPAVNPNVIQPGKSEAEKRIDELSLQIKLTELENAREIQKTGVGLRKADQVMSIDELRRETAYLRAAKERKEAEEALNPIPKADGVMDIDVPPPPDASFLRPVRDPRPAPESFRAAFTKISKKASENAARGRAAGVAPMDAEAPDLAQEVARASPPAPPPDIAQEVAQAAPPAPPPDPDEEVMDDAKPLSTESVQARPTVAPVTEQDSRTRVARGRAARMPARKARNPIVTKLTTASRDVRAGRDQQAPATEQDSPMEVAEGPQYLEPAGIPTDIPANLQPAGRPAGVTLSRPPNTDVRLLDEAAGLPRQRTRLDGSGVVTQPRGVQYIAGQTDFARRRMVEMFADDPDL